MCSVLQLRGEMCPPKGSKRLSLVSPSMMTFLVMIGLVIYGNVSSLIVRQVVSYNMLGYSSNGRGRYISVTCRICMYKSIVRNDCRRLIIEFKFWL